MDPVSPQPTEPIDVAAIKKSNKRKVVWGIICLVGPTALIVISLLFYAISNFVFSSVRPEPATCETTGSSSVASGADVAQNCEDELFQEQSTGSTIVNVILFLVGAVSVLTMLPGFIIGIILLATRKPIPPTAQ